MKHFDGSEVHLAVLTEVPSGALNSVTDGEAQATNANAKKAGAKTFMCSLSTGNAATR